MIRSVTAIGAAAIVLAGCQDAQPTAPVRHMSPVGPARSARSTAEFSPMLARLQQQLVAGGVKGLELVSAEISVSADSAGWDGATTIIANNRTHTLGSAFVPNDPRRGGLASISYLVDRSDANALSWANATTVIALPSTVIEPDIDASMLRWQNQPQCNAPAVVKIADSDADDPDLIDNLVLGGPLGTPFADITHGGWLPRAFFDAIGPRPPAAPGSTFILGVTFTFIFVDDAGVPTDNDRNGQPDAAFREIYYNARFGWGTIGSFARNVEVQSVVTHEAGHAYGLGHFGKVFVDNNGFLQYAPRAVMNAVYASPFRDLAGTDNASFCQLWANASSF